MELKPGLRLESATCDTQVVVVKAPRDAGDVGPTLLGKRYEAAGLGVEVLCTQGGAGSLTIGDAPLLVKGAKPLPSSD